MGSKSRPGRQAGFSLIELMVAMTITLIVSGAIYALLASGQGAFRREPELSDRQQNIRVAMDLIMRDVAAAGVGMPTFIQVFTRNLDACTSCPNGGAPMGPNSQVTDELELFTNNDGFEAEDTCHYPGGNSNILRLSAGNTFVQPPMTVLVFLADGSWTIRTICSVSGNSTSAGSCANGQEHVQVGFNSGCAQDTGNYNLPGGICAAGSVGTTGDNGACSQADCESAAPVPGCCCPMAISQGEVVHYRIRNGADGVPNLERMSSAVGGTGWQVIARGIEDLQVQYLTAALDPAVPGNWINGAPATDVTSPYDYNSLTTQVRVTLQARTEARAITGMTTAATAKTAARGQLTSTGVVRSALYNLVASPRPANATGTTWK